MTAPAGTSVTPALIADLARSEAAPGQLRGLDIQVLLSLWAPLDPWGTGSLYQQLFLNLATLPIDPAFQPNPDGSVLTDTTPLISDQFPRCSPRSGSPAPT